MYCVFIKHVTFVTMLLCLLSTRHICYYVTVSLIKHITFVTMLLCLYQYVTSCYYVFTDILCLT